MPIPYPRQDISARDDNGSESIGYKDENGLFRAVSATDPLPTAIINPVTGEPATTASGAMLIGNAKNKWRYEAATWGGANDEYFELVQAGSNQVVSALGDTGGSRYLNISSGIDAGSETILLSRETFTPPFTLTYAITLSQRIINCEAHMEMVEVDDTGAVVTDTSISLAPAFNNARSGF